MYFFIKFGRHVNHDEPYWFGGHSSKVKVMMGIIDKCGLHGDATLCVVIFIFCDKITSQNPFHCYSYFISPPPVKPEGTIGLHSVCLSVSLSVSLSVRHTSFRMITDSVINLWSWNFIHLLPMSQGCALLILGSKGQRSRSWRMVIWKWFPDDNWLCNQPMIMKLHTLTHHESRMRPIDFEVQRSRSWHMVIWKWFPDDNWLCNQPMIMKLHTLTHHESRMCPIDFEVKRSKVKVMAHGYLKMVSGR